MKILLLAGFMALIGCDGHKLSGYNLKGNLGQTIEDTGHRSLYTGASADFHFDVK